MSLKLAQARIQAPQFYWSPQQGLTVLGIYRASTDLIKAWVQAPPEVNLILNHPTNPLHRAPDAWWTAQSYLYGLEYKITPGENATRKAISQFVKSIAAMKPFRPTAKISTIENRLSISALQTPSARVPSNPSTFQNNSTGILSGSGTPINHIISAPSATVTQQRSNRSPQTTTGIFYETPYVIPARRDLKRKDPPESSEDDAAPRPASKLRKTRNSQAFESSVTAHSPSPSQSQPKSPPLSPSLEPSSHDIVRHEWLKVRKPLPAPAPPAEVPLIPSLCMKCETHVRACKCQVCSVCWKIEEECVCQPCIVCEEKACICTTCMECMEKACVTIDKFCHCYCKACKTKYLVLTPKHVDKVCECKMTTKQTMQIRLGLLNTLEKLRSKSRQNTINALTDRLSTDWLADNIPNYFKDEVTRMTAPKALENIAGFYELFWNDFKDNILDRPKLAIEVDSGVVWACCFWGSRITSIMRMEKIPNGASTLPINCHIAYPKGMTMDSEWSFEDAGLIEEDAVRSIHSGGIRVLGETLLLLDHSVIGITREAPYPAVIFGVKVSAPEKHVASIEGTSATANEEAVSASTAGSRRLYIEHLAYTTTEADLKHFFSDYDVDSITLPVKKRADDLVGYAFVDVKSAADAESAVKNLDGKSFSGKTFNPRNLRVQLARELGEMTKSRRSQLHDPSILENEMILQKFEPSSAGDESSNGRNGTALEEPLSEEFTIKKLWDLKHQRYCTCGHEDEAKAAEAHRWNNFVEQDGPQWDEELIDQAVARLLEDPIQEFRSIDRLFMGVGDV